MLQDFSSVLSVDPSSSNGHKPAMENGLSPQENGHQDTDVKDDKDGVISSSLMVKLVVMAISTVTRLQSNSKCPIEFEDENLCMTLCLVPAVNDLCGDYPVVLILW